HRRSWFVYVVKLAQAVDRNGVMSRLGEEGIASKPYLPSIHLQPFYRERFGYREGMLPVSEDASARTLALPFHARLSAEDQGRVVEALGRAIS
ncbi:MAG TPA: DegT/DnrJ/EryC1/StrS family aminotransferase, partial [Gaiellaceae bacterium]|nr:DegT/DnrJ/EryC1/StrS family aminotransferase [Gaiellaceae bacterium]